MLTTYDCHFGPSELGTLAKFPEFCKISSTANGRKKNKIRSSAKRKFFCKQFRKNVTICLLILSVWRTIRRERAKLCCCNCSQVRLKLLVSVKDGSWREKIKEIFAGCVAHRLDMLCTAFDHLLDRRY